MATKKKEIKPVKAIKKVAKKEKKAKAVPILQNKETLLPASKIGEILNIPGFELFIIKTKYNFDDSALFTISQFKEMYKETIKEGR